MGVWGSGCAVSSLGARVVLDTARASESAGVGVIAQFGDARIVFNIDDACNMLHLMTLGMCLT